MFNAEKELNFLNNYRVASKTSNNSNANSRVNSSLKYSYNNNSKKCGNKGKNGRTVGGQSEDFVVFMSPFSNINVNNKMMSNKKEWGHSQISLIKNTPKITLLKENKHSKKHNKYSNSTNKTTLMNNFINNSNSKSIMFNYKKSRSSKMHRY